MTRTLSILATLAFLVLSLLALVGLGGRLLQGAAPDVRASAGDPRDACGFGSEHALTGFWLVDQLTNNGSYMARTQCMVTEQGATDWPWVFALLGLNAIVIAGYLKIFIFWRRAYVAEQPEDRNKKLMDLAWIFLWCAVCGYAASILMFFWPAYRLVALCLVPLAFFTWRFASNLDTFRLSLSAKRLQRELEESLRARTEELEAAVEQRTRELEEARHAAEQANDAKSAFFANMSHEIRTPMTAILGFADLLDDPAVTDETRGEFVQRIRVSGQHLLTVINDVLDMSKIESGKMRVDPVSCPAHRVIAEAVALFEQTARELGIRLELDIAGPFPERIRTDPTRLRQIVMNLVSNAVKFTPEGGVTVRARVRAIENRGSLVLEVADTGIGMTHEQSARLFKPFEQVEHANSRRFGGSGLGLAISRTLARLLGGDIALSSEPGAGSTFTVTLDAGSLEGVCMLEDPLRENTQPTPREHPGYLDRGGRVLIVDDGVDNRRLLRFHLERAGAEVHEAADGFEAVDAVTHASRPFDLVLMDLQMPGMDGRTAMRHIKGIDPALPVVACTAHAMDSARDACLRDGFDDVATKPIEPRRFVALCRSWLGTPERPAA
ncbi:MAG: ATP-binding protein [Phycisphaerales bacterium]